MEMYHLINRGVDKRDVFMDDRDRVRFIRDLFLFNDKNYVCSTTRKDKNTGKTELITKRDLLVRIHAFCLMPNHYHLLVSAVNDNFENISLFMKKVNKGYTQAFNVRHERSGALWQGKYKKVLIEHDSHFLYIPYYIHCNPLDLIMPEWRKGDIKNTKKALAYLHNYKWSSHLDYLNVRNFTSVIYKDVIGDMLGTPKHYQKEILNIITNEKLVKNSDMIEMHK